MNPVVPLEVDVPCLFQAPQRITAQVNRDVLITMHCPMQHVVGAYLFTRGHHLEELAAGLDLLLNKLTKTFNVPNSNIQVRALGMSSPNPILTGALNKWCTEKKVSVVAQDLGRNVQRNVIIDCETGKVGVSYAESTPMEKNFLVAEGTAGERDLSPSRFRQALILGESRTNRHLCRQAIESLKTWKATVLDRPFDMFVAPKWEEFHFDAVILLADIGDAKPVQKWLSLLIKKHPAAKRIWVGAYPAKWDAMTETLPSFEPHSMATFQTQLRESLVESEMSPGAKVFRINP